MGGNPTCLAPKPSRKATAIETGSIYSPKSRPENQRRMPLSIMEDRRKMSNGAVATGADHMALVFFPVLSLKPLNIPAAVRERPNRPLPGGPIHERAVRPDKGLFGSNDPNGDRT